MWPWEHLAFGYLAYGVAARATGRAHTTPGEAYAIAFATQFPDLVDKPLAWTFAVLPSGVSLAHSAFTAVPLAVIAVLVARRYGRASAGWAFAVGYLSHLVGDLLYPLATTGRVDPGYLLWPLVAQTPVESGGSLATALRLLSRFGEFLATPRGLLYLLLELLLMGGALALWAVDGFPGLGRPTG